MVLKGLMTIASFQSTTAISTGKYFPFLLAKTAVLVSITVTSSLQLVRPGLILSAK